MYARVAATRVSRPRLVKLNRPLAELLGADVEALLSPVGAEILSGNAVPEGAEPIALAYAGHQFGHFVPQLGDGRALLLGEVVCTDGKRRDVQLKGAGRTPFSRGGDGRAALGPVLREYVVSEAMAALGVPTTRALSVVTTGERVLRDEPLEGAILARIAASHIRVGTFQFFAARRDHEALRALASHALARHYPDAVGTNDDALALLAKVIDAQADLVAQWLGVGFVHGVMNTDNTAISGETIDYGPCAFLDEYDPQKTFSSIDHQGRYAFANQPNIALWNMARLAEALLPILGGEREEAARVASERLERFAPRFERAYLGVMRRKLGLVREDEGDPALIEGLLDHVVAHELDYTVFFRELCAAAEAPRANDDEPEALRAWRRRLALEEGTPAEAAARMRRANPAFIPRNHKIEELIAAARGGDFGPFETMVDVLARPYDDQPEHADLAAPPKPEERVQQTFCGT
jgi:serine/tyrosine/threonine adenylyltransferase